MKNRKTDEEIIEELGELYDIAALKIVRVGTNEINFKILNMLPSNIENMMEDLNYTKAPVTIRVNLLEEMGLVKWFKGTGKVIITDFGIFFLDKIKTFEEIVREHMVRIVINHINQ